jgi:protein phosphatase
MQSLQVTAAGHSQTGKRPQNEDAFLLDLAHGVFVVADGMGGLNAGEEASRLATAEIPRVIQQRILGKDLPEEAVAIALEYANQKIIQQAKTDPAMQGISGAGW